MVEIIKRLRRILGRGTLKEWHIAKRSIGRARADRDGPAASLIGRFAGRRREREGMNPAPRLRPILAGDESLIAKLFFIVVERAEPDALIAFVFGVVRCLIGFALGSAEAAIGDEPLKIEL